MRETPAYLLEMMRADGARVPALGLGFLKSAVPPDLHQRLLDHLGSNIRKFKSEPANDFLKTEDTRSYPSLLYQDEAFNQQLLRDMKQAHVDWCGKDLVNAACYGIRVYQPGSYLYNHIDRARTHIVSSTICVDHRVNRPWPLYIEDLEGRAHEVTIDPGEMVFFEGARLMHGRPHALVGEYYANIFVHYTPLDWPLTEHAPDRS